MHLKSGIQYLSDALKVNSTLTFISIGYHGISSGAILPFAKAIEINTSIQSIELHGDIDWTRVLESFKINSSIQTIYMSGSRLNSESMAMWSQVVQCNSTITSIRIFYDDIDQREMIPLFVALKINSSITKLDLYFNNIDDTGWVALAEVLKINLSVTMIQIENLTINDQSRILETRHFGNCTMDDPPSNFGTLTLAEVLSNFNSCITSMKFWNIPESFALKPAVKRNVVQVSSLPFDRFMHEACMDV